MANPDRSTVAGSAAIRAPDVGPPVTFPFTPPRRFGAREPSIAVNYEAADAKSIDGLRRKAGELRQRGRVADAGSLPYPERVSRHPSPPRDKYRHFRPTRLTCRAQVF